jgi:hypothetical protein
MHDEAEGARCCCLPKQAVKAQLQGYERGLAAAKAGAQPATPRSAADMAVVQAKLRGYSEVR